MFLLDTNVLSELRRLDRASPNVVAWSAQHSETDFHISVVSILEIRHGALLLQRRDPTQAEVFLAWLMDRILPNFPDRILPITTPIALACAALHVPDPKPDRDAWIAATALVHNLTVVTRNTRDFAATGVRLFNPWEAG